MSKDLQDAGKLAEKIIRSMDGFDNRQRQDESFLALDANRYELTIKLLSPFGQGLSREVVESSNELQQRINHWLGVQRSLGSVGSIRVVITPRIDENE